MKKLFDELLTLKYDGNFLSLIIWMFAVTAVAILYTEVAEFYQMEYIFCSYEAIMHNLKNFNKKYQSY